MANEEAIGQLKERLDALEKLIIERLPEAQPESITKFYKNFNKGTSALMPRHREALTTAVNMLGPAAYSQDRADNYSDRGRGFICDGWLS